MEKTNRYLPSQNEVAETHRREHPQHHWIASGHSLEACCDLDKIDKEGTFEDLMKLLDDAFRYDGRVRLPQDFDAYFTHLSRKPGETLLSYVTEHDEKLRKVQERGIQIPDEAQGWLLLKKSGVTKEQQQMVITQAPKMEKLRIQEALFLLSLAGDFFPLPWFFFLICSVFRPLHLSCHFPSMLHAICSILELEPFILHVLCSIWELEPSMLHAICSILELELSILHAIYRIWAQEPSI